MTSNSKCVEDALCIFQEALASVNPYDAVKKMLRLTDRILTIQSEHPLNTFTYDLTRYRHIFVIGAGKCSASMALAVEALLRNKITNGHVVVSYGYSKTLKNIKCAEAGHPIPDSNGIEATRKIVQILENCGPHDLVICLISGGGSSLLVRPLDGLSLDTVQKCTELLLSCGATIAEINCIRKHLSRVKGGQLAKIAYPATVITLVVSDVVGDDLDTIASGPTVPDPTTFTQADRIVRKYHLQKIISKDILHVIEAGLKRQIPETPKKRDNVFRYATYALVCNNQRALLAAQKTANDLGYHTMMLTSSLTGEARETAKIFSSLAQEVASAQASVKLPVCITSGGETTVTVCGKGLGGRNQELALGVAAHTEVLRNWTFLSCDTDGIDGPTDAAGAFSTHRTKEIALQKGIDLSKYLENNDSYHFFEKVGGLIKTGPTFTNVMDIQVMLVR